MRHVGFRWTKEREFSISPFNIANIFPPLIWALSLASMVAISVILITTKLVGDEIGTESHSRLLPLFPFRLSRHFCYFVKPKSKSPPSH